MNRFVIERVPKDLVKRFKAQCIIEGKSMREKVVEYMEREVSVSNTAQAIGPQRGGHNE